MKELESGVPIRITWEELHEIVEKYNMYPSKLEFKGLESTLTESMNWIGNSHCWYSNGNQE